MSEQIDLQKPTKEQAQKELSKCGYEERIIGARMHPMAGNQRKPLRSLEEVHNFLKVEGKEKLLVKGSGATINYLRPNTLADWIEDIYGDEELAEKIRKGIEDKDNYMDEVKVVKRLIGERLQQCGEVLKED